MMEDYHLPHQNFIRDYKIIFSLFNLHERFGWPLYMDISHHFLIKNDLLILTYLQSSFFFIIYFLKKNYFKSNTR